MLNKKAKAKLTTVAENTPEQCVPKVATELSDETRAILPLLLTGLMSQAGCAGHKIPIPATSGKEHATLTANTENNRRKKIFLVRRKKKDKDDNRKAKAIIVKGGREEGVGRNNAASETSKLAEEADDKVTPYKRGTKKPHISPEKTLYPEIRKIYATQGKAIFTTYNLREHFPNYKAFIVNEDPITHEPITFLGKPISGGVNLAMIPFLKIAERKIMDMGLDYAPAEKQVIGFEDRNMAVRNAEGKVVLHAAIPSFHKYGLAFDIDRSSNSPDHGRGNIPDEVILALVEAGFAAGSLGRPPNTYYLVDDFMHSEMQFTPNSPEGQRIINTSPIGIIYWEAVRPTIEALKKR